MAATRRAGAHDPRFIVAGCGYAGLRVATRLRSLGAVRALTGSPAGVARCAGAGIESLACDLDAVQSLPLAADDVDGAVITYLVPPPRAGDTDPRLARFVELLPATPARIVYLSTSGVYGDAGGTVTEDSAPQPGTARARRRLDAETRLRAWCEAQRCDWVILRVPGIYGPGRLPIERLRRGLPALAEAEAGPGNRIHVDDLARACVAAATAPQAARRIYNVADGEHLPSPAFLALVARLAGLPEPRQLPLRELAGELSPAALSFLSERRRLDATRMREELGVVPHYARAEDGIRASLPGG